MKRLDQRVDIASVACSTNHIASATVALQSLLAYQDALIPFLLNWAWFFWRSSLRGKIDEKTSK